MEKFIQKPRLIALFLLLVFLLGLYFATLYKLQIIDGQAYYESSTNSIVTTETVTAARGNIYDRYGRLLVSNRNCNNIVINTTELFEQDDPNAIILELISIVEAAGETYTDTMPITTEQPFEYVENMTSLQQTFLSGFLSGKGMDANSSAVDLLAYCRERYGIDNSYSGAEARKIAGVRYEINGRYEVSTADYIFVEDAGIDLITKLLESNLPGFDVEVSYIREYNTQYASHILGYTTAMMGDEYYETYEKLGYKMDAQVGRDGVEKAFEEYLHGIDGTVRVTSTSTGIVTGKTYIEEPQPGEHVYLTIDIGLQESAEQALTSYIDETNAGLDEANELAILEGREDDVREYITGGGIAVVKVDTGEPLVIASAPNFNIETLLEDYSDLLENENNPLFNRALNGIYAPGSTFKPVTSIAALCEGIITTTTTIFCDGIFTKYEAEGYAPVCWIYGQGAHGDLNVTSALEHSCNYFYYTVGDLVGIDKLNEYTRAFGLSMPTGIELTESEGTLSTEEYKMSIFNEPLYLGDTLQASIGQGWNQFTPLQLAEYTAVIANGGTRNSASILKSVRSYDYSEILYLHETEQLSTVEADEEYFKAVQDGMYAVANSVTGTGYSVFGNYAVEVAAKTGTAQMGDEVTNNAVSIVYAPAENPEIAIAIAVEKGGAGSEVSSIAIPILDYYFSFQNATTTTETEMTLLK